MARAWCRRRIVQRSRSAVGWSLAGFAALQLGMALAMRLFFPALSDPAYRTKAARLEDRLRSAAIRPLSIVMLGSSRTVFGLRGQLLEVPLARELNRPVVAFNFGFYGAGPVTEMLYVRRLLAQGIRPDLLLLEVFPPLLDGKQPRPWEANYLTANRLKFQEINFLQKYGFDPRLLRTWWQVLSVPWYGQRFNLLSYVASGWLPLTDRLERFAGIDNSGWVAFPYANPPREARRIATEKAHQEFVSFLTDYRLGGPSCRALCDLLDLCRQQGIRAGLVLMPEGTQFRSWYESGASQQIQAFLGQLQGHYGVPVVDARTWVADEGFADSHHLLPQGARVFSQRLEGEVQKILKKKK